MKDLMVISDGSAVPNPGVGKIGYIIIDGSTGELVARHGSDIGHVTNNVAEFKAMIAALRRAAKFKPDRVVAISDSRLVVHTMNKDWKLKASHLKPLLQKLKYFAKQFEQIKFVWKNRDYKYIQQAHDLAN